MPCESQTVNKGIYDMSLISDLGSFVFPSSKRKPNGLLHGAEMLARGFGGTDQRSEKSTSLTSFALWE